MHGQTGWAGWTCSYCWDLLNFAQDGEEAVPESDGEQFSTPAEEAWSVITAKKL